MRGNGLFTLKASLAGLTAAGLVFLSAAGAVEQADLKNVKKQIASQQQQITERQQQLDTLQRRLKKIEQQVAATAAALDQTRRQLQQNRSQLGELQQQQQELLQRRSQQLQRLERQLVAAYTAGSNDYLKMLLNPGSPAELERTMSYYRYLNKARVQSLEQLQLTEAELKATGNQLQQARAQLDRQQQQQQQQQQALTKQQAEGSQARTALNRELKNDRQRLAQLQQAEAQLKQKLEEARRRQQAEQQRQQQLRQLQGLARYKGKLDWPLTGKILHRFGSIRGGELTWKGMLIAADEGKPVHAVYNGQVVFADWLRGYGMVIAVDHGDNFLSLYGHNQAFLKKVGDYVEAGEPLALAGQTGGAEQPSLYFEIRQRGETVNPSLWLK